MTATTINRVALLHALAEHVARHDLADDISGISFSEIDWDGVAVQVHLPATVAAWVRSLDEVAATGHKGKDSIHIHITGTRSDFAVQVKFVLSSKRIPPLYKQLARKKLGGDVFEFLPIELPEALGGTR